MSKLTYRTPQIDEALRISILLKTVYIQTYAREGITSELANFLTTKFSLEKISEIITENPDQIIVAYNDEKPIGVAIILFHKSCPIRNIPVPELDKLYILESFYGNGVGLGLISEVEKAILKKGLKKINLEVYVGNARAISFYKKHGYVSIGTVDFPLEDNIYENYVMTKDLS